MAQVKMPLMGAYTTNLIKKIKPILHELDLVS